MNVLIENYRGVDILFNPNDEMFNTSISDYNKGSKSYAVIKKYIDDYIKDNNQFEPFFIVNTSEYSRDTTGKPIKVIGIRKDQRFIIENTKGEKEQLSEYNEKDYSIYQSEIHDKYFATLAYLESLADDARKSVETHKKSMSGISLISVKANYIPK